MIVESSNIVDPPILLLVMEDLTRTPEPDDNKLESTMDDAVVVWVVTVLVCSVESHTMFDGVDADIDW
jgi:hypothetical protein